MTEEAQRIALAKEMHWQNAPFNDTIYYVPMLGKLAVACDPLRDLNAMAEAEKTLPENELEAYCFELRCSVAEDGCVKLSKSPLLYEIPNLVRANPHQRREAFLRVKGLWVD